MDDFHQLRRSGGGGSFPRDLGPTEITARRALARCQINMLASTTASVAANAMNKGDVLATARVAGIQAAKQAANLLPMSHPVLIGNVYVNFTIADTHIDVEVSVDTVDRTGVEMEALTAVTVAALTVYDMCKSIDRTMTIENVALWEKSGGRSGSWRREGAPETATGGVEAKD
ncbi:MAG TPA: cyclic pyranopterin monophosphate synthase MoaC [Acidimicrobiales bacterium]|nr:cyclic pyranopterin monophosphate synthase MoaC [Acidimicrobiales bacterium]